MASIYKRKNDDGTTAWRAVIRIKGHPSVCKSFERKEEALDWAQETERSIKRGQFNFEAAKRQHTYLDLIERLHADRALEHQRSFKNVRSQFDYWKQRLGTYALIHITYELISKERQHLIDRRRAKRIYWNPRWSQGKQTILEGLFAEFKITRTNYNPLPGSWRWGPWILVRS